MSKIKTKCHECAKEILKRSDIVAKRERVFCSRTCHHKNSTNTIRVKGDFKGLKLNEDEKFFWSKCQDIKSNAKSRNLPFDLDFRYLMDLFYKQKGKCFYSGILLKRKSSSGKRGRVDYDTLSLDKLIPEKGYIKNNVVFAANCVNNLKSDYSLEDLKIVCKAIMMKEKNNLKVNIKKLYSDAQMPFKEHPENAGYDLYVHSVEDCGHYIKVYTGVAIQPDLGYYFMLAPRSSSYKKGLSLYNNLGIIDNNYTGQIIAVFYKTEEFKELPLKGDRLVQLIPQEQIWADIVEVQELSETNRGQGGFGSSGR